MSVSLHMTLVSLTDEPPVVIEKVRISINSAVITPPLFP